jgi:L-rhamnose mutarotase
MKIRDNFMSKFFLHHPVILEQCTVESIQKFKQGNNEHLKYSWNHYAELARQRNEIMPELIHALTSSCISDSHVFLDDETPHEKVPKRIDSQNWRMSELTAKEIFPKF